MTESFSTLSISQTIFSFQTLVFKSGSSFTMVNLLTLVATAMLAAPIVNAHYIFNIRQSVLYHVNLAKH